jgi:prohibitin 2
MNRIPNIPIGAIIGGLGAAGSIGSLGYLAYNGVYSVKPGERAIIFNRISGIKDVVKSEGTHILVPWFEWPIIMDVRTRPRAMKSVTGTRGEFSGRTLKVGAVIVILTLLQQTSPLRRFIFTSVDLQMVDLGLRVLTRPDASALPTIYRRLGLDYDDKVLPSIVNEVVKQVMSNVASRV